MSKRALVVIGLVAVGCGDDGVGADGSDGTGGTASGGSITMTADDTGVGPGPGTVDDTGAPPCDDPGAPCDDADPCTTDDVCSDAFECRGSPMACEQPPGECYEAAGTCVDGACSYPPRDGVACDDADPCTIDDACEGGACQGTAMECSMPPNACFEAEGTCVEGACTHAPLPLDGGFADAAVDWPLPAGFSATDEVLDDLFHDSDFGCAAAGVQLTVGVLDLTGDGRPDLVVSDACDVAGVGTDTWQVYESTGLGFADAPTAWSLPAGFPATEEVLDDLAHDSDFGCAAAGVQLTVGVLDLTADGRPDLVVTDACDVAGVGTDTWQVYESTGSGFADAPTVWSLPAGFPATDEVLDDLFHDSDLGCAAAGVQLTTSLLDLSGDGSPDLVVTDACDVAGVGTDDWRIYENTGSGFADAPSEWTLPAGFPATEEVLDDLAHDSDFGCAAAGVQLTTSVLDLDGDGALELVVTDACDAADVGTVRWRVYTPSCSG